MIFNNDLQKLNSNKIYFHGYYAWIDQKRIKQALSEKDNFEKATNGMLERLTSMALTHLWTDTLWITITMYFLRLFYLGYIGNRPHYLKCNLASFIVIAPLPKELQCFKMAHGESIINQTIFTLGWQSP